MSKAEEKGRELARKFGEEYTAAAEGFAKLELTIWQTIGEATLSLLEARQPITNETLLKWLTTRMEDPTSKQYEVQKYKAARNHLRSTSEQSKAGGPKR